MLEGRSRWALTVLWLAACSPGPEAEPGRSTRDAERDGLFRDFFDGKYDAAGHPLGARVFEAEKKCHPEIGGREAEGWGAHPDTDGAGRLCNLTVKSLGQGPFTISVRALTQVAAGSGSEAEDEAFVVRVRDAAGLELGARQVKRGDFQQALTYRNVTLGFTHATAAAEVKVEVQWAGLVPVRLDYVEVFPALRRVLLAPPSGVPAKNAVFQIDLANPPPGAAATVACGAVDRTPVLEELLTQNRAQREDGELHQRYRAPMAELLQGCTPPSRVRVQMKTLDWVRETSRVTVLAEEPPCAFGLGKRVLLTGFEPFPADSSSDNSSEQAVLQFDDKGLTGVSVMRVILPVEWDTAAAMLGRLIDRCDPDVVIGFGQGRSVVDVETVAFNLKDASDLAGGSPDNRGQLMENVKIAKWGPAKLATRLPAAQIVAALVGQGVQAQASDDPGRYICNNLFYAMMHKLRSSKIIGAGFVHLPHLYRVGDDEKKMLQTVVQTVIARTLQPAANER